MPLPWIQIERLMDVDKTQWGSVDILNPVQTNYIQIHNVLVYSRV